MILIYQQDQEVTDTEILVDCLENQFVSAVMITLFPSLDMNHEHVSPTKLVNFV